MKSLILGLLVVYSYSYECWQYSCANLDDSDLCAKNEGNLFYIRNSHCGDGKICNLADVIDSFASGQPSYACQLETDIPAIDSDFQVDEDYNFKDSSACERLQNKDLQSGSYPKQCITEDDCILQDTTTTSCKCGFNISVCVPHYSSSFFDEWYTACEESEPDRDMYYQIWMVRKYYPWLVTYANSEEFACAYEVMDDLREVREYYDKVIDGTFYEKSVGMGIYLGVVLAGLLF